MNQTQALVHFLRAIPLPSFRGFLNMNETQTFPHLPRAINLPSTRGYGNVTPQSLLALETLIPALFLGAIITVCSEPLVTRGPANMNRMFPIIFPPAAVFLNVMIFLSDFFFDHGLLVLAGFFTSFGPICIIGLLFFPSAVATAVYALFM